MGCMRHRQECSKYEQRREDNQQTAMGKIRHFGTPLFLLDALKWYVISPLGWNLFERAWWLRAGFLSMLPASSAFVPAASNHQVTAAGIKKRHWTLNRPMQWLFGP